MEKEYALYKGDELLGIGTLTELAKQRNVKEETIYYYSMPAYQRKPSKASNKRMVAVKLD